MELERQREIEPETRDWQPWQVFVQQPARQGADDALGPARFGASCGLIIGGRAGVQGRVPPLSSRRMWLAQGPKHGVHKSNPFSTHRPFVHTTIQAIHRRRLALGIRGREQRRAVYVLPQSAATTPLESREVRLTYLP
jgi:hypothetical protein